VSRRFATSHHEIEVRADDFLRLWEDLTWHRDAPISEPADIAVARLAEVARQHVKVVLSGEGSDELFGGYPKYRFANVTARAEFVPNSIRSAMLPRLERAFPASWAKLRIAVRAMSDASIGERMASWFAPFTQHECDVLLGTCHGETRTTPGFRDPIDLMARQDFAGWLPDNLLERGDRMSMASSLELRPPFLDRRLIELAFRLPSAFKVRGGETKWILKEVAARHLPTEIVHRPKVGFRVPLGAWFRGGLRDLAADLLGSQDSFVLQMMNPRAVQAILRDHERGRRNEEIRIWTLLSLEVWARRFLR